MGNKGNSHFLIKQRPFLKVFLLSELEKGQMYGLQLRDVIWDLFKIYGFRPDHTEIYRSLHELTEEGYLKKFEEKVNGAKYKTVEVYKIADIDKVKAYKKLVKADLDRSESLIKKAKNEIY